MDSATEELRRQHIKTLEVLRGAEKLHVRARGPHPQYPPRGNVPNDKVAWSASFPNYEPVAHTAAAVIENDRDKVPEEQKPRKGWADPDLPFDLDEGARLCLDLST